MFLKNICFKTSSHL